MVKYIKIDVRCQGCRKLIDKPSDADAELMRLGLMIHNNFDCEKLMEERLRENVSDVWEAEDGEL